MPAYLARPLQLGYAQQQLAELGRRLGVVGERVLLQRLQRLLLAAAYLFRLLQFGRVCGAKRYAMHVIRPFGISCDNDDDDDALPDCSSTITFIATYSYLSTRSRRR